MNIIKRLIRLCAGRQRPLAPRAVRGPSLWLEPLEPRTLLSFTDVTSFAFPGVSSIGRASWGDFNNDGWTDVWTGGQIRRNEGGVFTPVASVGGGEAYWGDFDNDGFLDLMTHSGANPRLFRNVDGTGTFTSVSLPSGIPSNTASQGLSLADFNGDGYLDVYIGGFEQWPTNYWPDYLLMSNGELSYALITQPIGSIRPARGVTSADFDEDGDMDVYVSNYRLERNYLWTNDRSGSDWPFADAAPALGATGGRAHTIGSAWGDLDSDGHIDLFVGNFSHPGQPQSQFLRNRGPADGYSFQNFGTAGLAWQESYASPGLADYDNDGYLDLYLTTVYPGDHSVLYRNNGNMTFSDVTAEAGLSGASPTYDNSWVDYDNDGDLDLSTNGKLYSNDGNANNWLELYLGGDGVTIGAQVRVIAGSLVVTRQVESGTGQGNQNDLTLHFGLGSHSTPVEVEIVWLDGSTGRFWADPNQKITVGLYSEDFDDGVADLFQPLAGAWQVNCTGQYEVTPEPGSAAISLVSLAGPLPAQLRIAATLNGDADGGGFASNALLIFDYKSPSDFKYAGGFFTSGQWRIGHVEAGSWVTDAGMSEPISALTDYRVELFIEGSRVVLSVDGVVKVSYDFGESLQGQVGLGTHNAVSRFDDFGLFRF